MNAMPLNTSHAAYYAALDADNAWQRELVKQFGARAGDVRYTETGQGAEGSTLRKLHDAKLAADSKLHEEWSR